MNKVLMRTGRPPPPPRKPAVAAAKCGEIEVRWDLPSAEARPRTPPSARTHHAPSPRTRKRPRRGLALRSCPPLIPHRPATAGRSPGVPRPPVRGGAEGGREAQVARGACAADVAGARHGLGGHGGGAGEAVPVPGGGVEQPREQRAERGERRSAGAAGVRRDQVRRAPRVCSRSQPQKHPWPRLGRRRGMGDSSRHDGRRRPSDFLPRPRRQAWGVGGRRGDGRGPPGRVLAPWSQRRGP